MTISARLKHLLDDNHVFYSVLSHPRAFTAQAVAATMHVPGKEVAKSVVLAAGEETILAVLPASHHIDLLKLSAALGREVHMVSEADFVSRFPDCEPGAMPPFGKIYGMPVVVDRSLADDEEIVCNAGSHREAVRMRYSDFEKLTNPTLARFAYKG